MACACASLFASRRGSLALRRKFYSSSFVAPFPSSSSVCQVSVAARYVASDSPIPNRWRSLSWHAEHSSLQALRRQPSGTLPSFVLACPFSPAVVLAFECVVVSWCADRLHFSADLALSLLYSAPSYSSSSTSSPFVFRAGVAFPMVVSGSAIRHSKHTQPVALL